MISKKMVRSLRAFAESEMQGTCVILDGANTFDEYRTLVQLTPEQMPLLTGNDYPIKCSLQEIPRIPNLDRPGDSELDNSEYIVKLPVGTIVRIEDVVKVTDVNNYVNYVRVTQVKGGRDGSFTMEAHGQVRS